MEHPDFKAPVSRRLFLAGTGATVALAACGSDDKKTADTSAPTTVAGGADTTVAGRSRPLSRACCL